MHDLWNVTPDHCLFSKGAVSTRYSASLIPYWCSLVCVVTGESLVKARGSTHTNQGIFRTLIGREGAKRIHLPTPHWLGSSGGGPRLLWQLLWALFGTHINQVLVVQGWYALSHRCSCNPSSFVPDLLYLLEGCLSGLGLQWGHHHSDCQGGANALWAKPREAVRTGSGPCRQTQVSFHIAWPHRLIHDRLLPIVQALELIPLDSLPSVQRLVVRAHE